MPFDINSLTIYFHEKKYGHTHFFFFVPQTLNLSTDCQLIVPNYFPEVLLFPSLRHHHEVRFNVSKGVLFPDKKYFEKNGIILWFVWFPVESINVFILNLRKRNNWNVGVLLAYFSFFRFFVRFSCEHLIYSNKRNSMFCQWSTHIIIYIFTREVIEIHVFFWVNTSAVVRYQQYGMYMLLTQR